MHHFVLTRFNIASQGREAPIRNSPGWLSRRFDLFEDYCLPSMAAQSANDFHWLIYFDDQTPTEFRKRIEEARRAVPFEPVFVGPFHAGLAAIDIGKRLDTQSGRLLTTRLDNDDAVSSGFLEAVRAVATNCTERTIINFRNGIALKDGRLFEAEDVSNPFTSMVEDISGAKTIWAARHTELGSRFRVEQVETQPCWLQVVHGENVANRIKGRQLSSYEVLSRFELGEKVEVRSTSRLDLLLDRLFKFPLRRMRELLIAIAKRILRR